MTPLLHLFKMESISDIVTNSVLWLEFLSAEKETMGNICKWLGNVAVNRSTVDRWAIRVTDGGLGKAQLLCVLQQLETWWWPCSGTLKEWFSLMWCREERKLIQTHISAHWKKWGSICLLLKCDNTASPASRLGKPLHNMDGWCYCIHPTGPAYHLQIFTSSDPFKNAFHRRKFESNDDSTQRCQNLVSSTK